MEDPNVVTFMEFDRACVEFFRTGAKPEWLEVEPDGPGYAMRLRNDKRPKFCPASKDREEKIRRQKRHAELYLQAPDFYEKVCHNWVTVGYCACELDVEGTTCEKEHPSDLQAEPDTDWLDNLISAYEKHIEKNGCTFLDRESNQNRADISLMRIIAEGKYNK